MHIIGSLEYYRDRAMAFRIIEALGNALGDWEGASSDCDLAYCDTAFENFDGNYDQFVDARSRAKHRAGRRVDLLTYIAGRNLMVMETLRAQGQKGLLWVIDSYFKSQAA